MWMSGQPRIPLTEFISFRANPQNLANLQPTKNHMEVRCPWNIAPTSTGVFFYLLEPAEEQKQVSNLDALRIQVRLCGTRLTKGWKPTILTGKSLIAQIRIEMR